MRLLRLLIECATPLHCGGGSDDAQDQPVVRDAFGYWRIPGSSLAGSLRAMGERTDPALAQKMFGHQDGTQSLASLIWCEDGLLLDYDGKPVVQHLLEGDQPQVPQASYVRDHVRLDLATGAAEDGGKFDAEIVPAGTRFLLELRCDGWDQPLAEKELAFFDELCALVLGGELSLGGKTGLGYGMYRVLAHAYRDLDLFSPAGMAAWLELPDFGLSVGGIPIPVGSPSTPRGAGLDGWIELPLTAAGPILVGGGNLARPEGTGGEGDIIFALTPMLDYEGKAHERWLPVLPASSLRGVFRHAVNAILHDLEIPDSRKILDGLFGFVDGAHASCGKLVFVDSPLLTDGKTAHYQFQPHVALDRFSGSALDGALFSEEPFWNEGARATLRIRACDLTAHEAALFFHALFDLLEGSLAIGSGVNRGNGRLELAGWRQDPRRSSALIKGDMTWQGTQLLDGTLEPLQNVAPIWDAALRQYEPEPRTAQSASA